MSILEQVSMSEKNALDAQFPNLKKWVTIPLLLLGLGFIAGGFGLFGGGIDIVRIIGGAASIVVAIGFWFNAKWARFIAGVGFLLLGLYIAIAPFIHIISAGTVGFQKYDPFAEIPPLLMALIVFLGLGTACGGIVLIAFVLEKKRVSTITTGVAPNSSLRYDGLYRSGKQPYGGYFRFYENGLVAPFYSPDDEPEQVATYVKYQKAKYALLGSTVEFSFNFGDGAMDYTGAINGDELTLNLYNHINGDKVRIVYQFVKIDGMKSNSD
jgi:hypothetical protein